MTKEEAKLLLQDVEIEMKTFSTYHQLASFRYFKLIHERSLIKRCLAANIDPDTVSFEFEIDEGKGTKFE